MDSEAPTVRATTDLDIERIVKRIGWVWGVLVALIGAIVWIITVAFSLGVSSTKYVTVETRAKDIADDTAARERMQRELQSISERTTRIEEKQNAMGANILDIKGALGQLKK